MGCTLSRDGMPSTSTRERIIIEFAMWAATSATKLGCPVRGGAWYPHLRKVNLADLFELTAPVSSERFSIWHRREVEALASRAGVPVGWAAKLPNMLTKVSVYIARYGDSSLQDLIHPPIDNRLVDAVHREFPIKGPSAQPSNHQIRIRCGRGKPILGVVSYEQYLEVIQGFRFVAERLNCTLFETEQLWKPKE